MNSTEHRIMKCFILTMIVLMSSSYALADNATCSPIISAEEQVTILRLQNEQLAQKIKQMEAVSCFPAEQLKLKKIQRLKDIAANVRVQRQTTNDFEGFVKWMSANLAGYSRYIQAGSYAAVIGKMMPIPYAGQASVFTKFVAQFTLALNAASVSVTNYLNSSQKYLVMIDSITAAKTIEDKSITDASTFADRQLLKDMNDAQARLATVSDLSSGALSFLESLNHFASGSDEYWNKAKGFFKKDVDPKEKSFISESTNNLKAQADKFNGKLKSFEEQGRKETTAVKALTVFDELALEAKPGVHL